MTSSRPAPFAAFTTPEFWDDPHVSAQMLACHLDPHIAAASRPHETVTRSVQWIIDTLGVGDGSRVLDLGCGPGLYAMPLARRGVITHGVDVSRRSVAHASQVAEREGLPATFEVANYLEDDLGGPYDAALLIYEDFCVLSPDQRKRLLRRTRAALRPGGTLVMDITAAPRFETQRRGHVHAADLDGGFWAPTPYEGTHETWTYPNLRLVLDRYTIHKDGQVRQFWNWMQCLTPEQVRDELSHASYRHTELHGDLAGAPYDADAPSFAVLTRRL